MNKFILVVVFLLSVVSFYLFFATPSSTNTIKPKPIESKTQASKIVVSSTILTHSEKEKIENSKNKTINKENNSVISTKQEINKETEDNNQNEEKENNIYYKKVGDIEVSVKSDDNQEIDLDESGEEGTLQTPSFPSLLNATIDKKPVLIQLPSNKNLVLTLKNKNGVKVKYEIDSTSLSNGKIINVGEITPKNFNDVKSQTDIKDNENIQDNIDTKIEESKTDNNPNNSIVPPAPPPL